MWFFVLALTTGVYWRLLHTVSQCFTNVPDEAEKAALLRTGSALSRAYSSNLCGGGRWNVSVAVWSCSWHLKPSESPAKAVCCGSVPKRRAEERCLIISTTPPPPQLCYRQEEEEGYAEGLSGFMTAWTRWWNLCHGRPPERQEAHFLWPQLPKVFLSTC